MTNTTGNVTRTLSRDEAWGWLVERGSVEMGGAELGRIWGWSRQRTDQWLDRLVQKGRIERRGRIVRVVNASFTPAEACQEPLTPAPSRELTDVDGAKNVPVFKGDERQLTGVDGTNAAAFVAAPTPTSTPRTQGVDWQRIAFIVPAIALAAIIMTANARYVAAFAQSWDAALLLAGLGLCAETFGLIIPAVAIRLWNGGQRVSAATVWVILGLVVVPINLLAISGWSSQNLGDSIMGRALAADRNQGLGARLDRLRDERKTLNETRSVAELDAALAAAQGAAGRAWGRTDECRRPDRGDMVACKRAIELREAHARAEQRDRLDREIDDLEARAAETPVISADDPGAVTIAEIVPWVTWGLIHPSERDVQRLRILLFSLLPTFSGLLLGIGASMGCGHPWRR